MIDEIDFSTITGVGAGFPDVRYSILDTVGPMDAPKFIAAGYMTARIGESIGAAVLRGGEQ